MDDLINKQSGLLGISGISSDMRDISLAVSKNDERAMLALKMFNGRIRKFIGAYAALMGGVDTIVFTGGIGKHTSQSDAGFFNTKYWLQLLNIALVGATTYPINNKLTSDKSNPTKFLTAEDLPI